MKKGAVNIILTIIAIIPTTLLVILSIFGLVNILSNFNVNAIPVLFSIVLGIFGYIGLWMNLKQRKDLKAEVLNFIFLLLGILGLVLFILFEGGMHAWEWIIMIKDPVEWLIFVGPILITLYLILSKGKRIIYMSSLLKGK